MIDKGELDFTVKKAIINATDNSGKVNSFTYLDPETKEVIAVNRSKEV